MVLLEEFDTSNKTLVLEWVQYCSELEFGILQPSHVEKLVTLSSFFSGPTML